MVKVNVEGCREDTATTITFTVMVYMDENFSLTELAVTGSAKANSTNLALNNILVIATVLASFAPRDTL